MLVLVCVVVVVGMNRTTEINSDTTTTTGISTTTSYITPTTVTITTRSKILTTTTKFYRWVECGGCGGFLLIGVFNHVVMGMLVVALEGYCTVKGCYSVVLEVL